MDIGIVRETYVGETRVPLIPFAVGELVRRGHRVVLQSEAGAASGYDDQSYREQGAAIVYAADEAIARSEMVLKVYPPSWEEYRMLEDGQVLFSFLQLSHATREAVEILLTKNVTAIGFEAIEEPGGNRPVMTAMSEIAGRLIMPIASHYLQARQGGRGILLGGTPGVAPATVVILGAGVAGTNAALAAGEMGAHVIVLDRDVARLRALAERGRTVVTSTSTPYNLERFVPIADVLVGAVFIDMEATPHLLNAGLIGRMRPGSVFADVAIDQGGCSTTSRPTTIVDPVYVEEGVTHFCVPNIPALVPRTATVALSNILLPLLAEFATSSAEAVLREGGTLARGFYTHGGYCAQRKIADPLMLPYREMVP
ncbi:MAG TPA: alanine dehydrogenase [Candidatus Polarisedimenticolaceae bacterium]|nr:alanine dehydrogenase [Candidatus Polarisedimenticolaceae bacterium]